MKASYKLALERQQRRLGLTHKQLNKYDREYNDHNLIKYLMSLNSIAANTGWYGTLEIRNSGTSETDMQLYSIRRSDTNDEVVIDTTLQAGDPITIELAIGDRLANPLTQLKIYWYSSGGTYINTIQSSTGVTAESYDSGFDLNQNAVKGNFTVDSGYINGGAISIVIRIFS